MITPLVGCARRRDLFARHGWGWGDRLGSKILSERSARQRERSFGVGRPDNRLSARPFAGRTAPKPSTDRFLAMPPFDYLNPALPAGLARVEMPVVDATDANLARYARL